MARFRFECPDTGKIVQVFSGAPVKVTEAGNLYVPVPCSCCGRTHNVDPATGNVLSSDDEGRGVIMS
jgi:hypothetical protein